MPPYDPLNDIPCVTHEIIGGRFDDDTLTDDAWAQENDTTYIEKDGRRYWHRFRDGAWRWFRTELIETNDFDCGDEGYDWNQE